MLYILLGPDNFSKKEHIKALAEKGSLEVEVCYAQEQLPPIPRFTEQNLFAKAKVFVIEQGIGKYQLDDKNVNLLANSANHIFFIEEKLDKRSAQNKKLLENKQVSVKNFILPHGKEIDRWIEKRVAELGGKITPKAADVLAQRIGRDETRETKFGGKVVEVKEIFDLWRLDGEIKKLLALARGRAMQEQDVEDLVSINEEADVLDIINAIGEKNKEQAVKLIGKFLAEETGDDKAKIIQLNALLSDQFRSLGVVQDFAGRRVTDEQILKNTGWKSGRLYVMKKNAGRFAAPKVLETLKKLEALDEELKTSNTPPRVLLDLIVSQLFI